MKSIKSFYFQNAKYLVSDEVGNSLVMIMDYKGNSFTIEMVLGNSDELKSEAEEVARKLLLKKHSVNFVERLEV